MNKIFIFFIATASILNVNAQKIYEVYTADGGTYGRDFIILTGFSPNQNVSGYRIHYRTNSGSTVPWPSGYNLTGNADAQGIFRIWHDPSGSMAGAPWPVQQTNGLGLSNTSSVQIALTSTTASINNCPSGGVVVDMFGFGPSSASQCFEGSSFIGSTSGSQSRRRKGVVPGQDTGNNANDFEIVNVSTTATVPVELANFTAQYKNQKTNLAWETASEVNSYAFDVERSNDGVNFTTIGQVKAEGRAYIYTFSDENPLAGTNYYRLKQLDVDGKFDYSPIRTVQLGKTTTVALYPNPTSLGTTTNLSYASIAEETLNIAMLDGLGRTISVQSIAVNKGDNMIPIETTDLSEGTYWVKISNETSVQTLPLMVK